jgi:Predicted S-adenosylmethionine-dependent methyltransferase involved in cell envelope biogenesis
MALLSLADRRHVPVLARPALELLNIRDGGIYIDGTFGAGGVHPRDPRRREYPSHRHRPRPERRGERVPVWSRRPAAGSP